VAACISSVLVGVCMSHCSGVDYFNKVWLHTDNELPEDDVTTLKHVGAILM